MRSAPAKSVLGQQLTSRVAAAMSAWGQKQTFAASRRNGSIHAHKSSQEQRLIRTVARKGFRFVGEVQEIRSSDDLNSSRSGSAGPGETSAQPLALPDRPSSAVLPSPSADIDQP
jgi:hypothetical protein